MKSIFCKNWHQKVVILIETLLYITKISAIMKYSIIFTNFYNVISCFQIFIVFKPRCYILDLSLSFKDIKIKATSKVTERQISLIKL